MKPAGLAAGEGAIMDEAARTARTMWTLFEPVHAVSYFTPEARSAFEDAGLRGFWRGYFAGRAAPLGVTGAAVVSASFYNFAPAMVARAIPGVWELTTPGEALRLRLAGAASALRRLLTGLDAEVAAAADLLGRAAGELDCAGRVLAAANAGLPVPDDLVARLWQAATTLREHRGDGHSAALLAAGVDGCEALVLRCGLELRREDSAADPGLDRRAVGGGAVAAGPPGLGRRRWRAHRRGAGRAPGRRTGHRRRRRAALGPPRARRRGGTDRCADPAGPGLRCGAPLSQPDRRSGTGVGGRRRTGGWLTNTPR